MICLDTNVVIAVVTGRIPIVRVRLSEQWRAGAEIQLPAIALFEMRYGAAKSTMELPPLRENSTICVSRRVTADRIRSGADRIAFR